MAGTGATDLTAYFTAAGAASAAPFAIRSNQPLAADFCLLKSVSPDFPCCHAGAAAEQLAAERAARAERRAARKAALEPKEPRKLDL